MNWAFFSEKIFKNISLTAEAGTKSSISFFPSKKKKGFFF